MEEIEIGIVRFDPSKDGHAVQRYKVPVEERSTILEALLYIYDNHDSTLAFRYGCRVKNCGLCAINADGRPVLACVAEVKHDMEISPLNNLPLIKDLVIDRTHVFHRLSDYSPFIHRKELLLGEPEVIIQPQEHLQLMSCRECLCCLSACPKYDYRNKHFGGPFGFVKLAQLFHDPRDNLDRVSQAKHWGIDACMDCARCQCVIGIPIYRLAVEPFLQRL